MKRCSNCNKIIDRMADIGVDFIYPTKLFETNPICNKCNKRFCYDCAFPDKGTKLAKELYDYIDDKHYTYCCNSC